MNYSCLLKSLFWTCLFDCSVFLWKRNWNDNINNNNDSGSSSSHRKNRDKKWEEKKLQNEAKEIVARRAYIRVSIVAVGILFVFIRALYLSHQTITIYFTIGPRKHCHIGSNGSALKSSIRFPSCVFLRFFSLFWFFSVEHRKKCASPRSSNSNPI